MLTENELQNLQNELTKKNVLLKEKYAAIDEILTLTAHSLNEFFKEVIDEEVECDFDYCDDYINNYQDSVPYGRVTVRKIAGESTSWSYVEISVYQDKVTYHGSSFDFTKNDKDAYTFKLVSKLFERELELKTVVFERYEKYDALRKERIEIGWDVHILERQIKSHEDEVKRNAALELLKEDCVYYDGASKYEDWYLKVIKITNKQVKCQVFCHYVTFNGRPEGNYYMYDRIIKKEDFLRHLESGFYKVSDKEVRYDW